MLGASLALSLLAAVAAADVATTVYCTLDCRDYISIPDADVPACDEAFMRRSIVCGTVISCDASEERARSNATRASCCVHTTITKDTSCAPPAVVEPEPAASAVDTRPMCGDIRYAWAAGVLFVVVILQAVYILFLLTRCRQQAYSQKVATWSPHDTATQPILLPRPLLQP